MHKGGLDESAMPRGFSKENRERENCENCGFFPWARPRPRSGSRFVAVSEVRSELPAGRRRRRRRLAATAAAVLDGALGRLRKYEFLGVRSVRDAAGNKGAWK